MTKLVVYICMVCRGEFPGVGGGNKNKAAFIKAFLTYLSGGLTKFGY